MPAMPHMVAMRLGGKQRQAKGLYHVFAKYPDQEQCSLIDQIA
jgi:hypothetical protein